MKNNPIGKVNLVATPNNMQDLEKYLANYSGSERVIATTCAFMAWNLASKIIDKQIEKEKENDFSHRS